MIAALCDDIVPSSANLNVTSLKDINETQCKHQPPTVALKGKDVTVRIGRNIWISNECANLKLKIAVHSRCGEKGHRANVATRDIVSREYW